METAARRVRGAIRSKEHTSTQVPFLQPFVQDALGRDRVSWTGDTNTHWGAVRAKLGHPKPFPLHYVEIGNEDWFDRSGSYETRFIQFDKAIKAKYPELKDDRHDRSQAEQARCSG